MEPVEGTMITVIRDWADSLFQLKERISDFTDLIIHSLDAAVLSLRQTPE
jgi:dihydroxyacetone kinase-like predicted kinase